MENTKINEMLNILKSTIKGANAIVLLFNGEQARFDYAFQQIIRYIVYNHIKLYFNAVIWKMYGFLINDIF